MDEIVYIFKYPIDEEMNSIYPLDVLNNICDCLNNELNIKTLFVPDNIEFICADREKAIRTLKELLEYIENK